eukprot:385393_1
MHHQPHQQPYPQQSNVPVNYYEFDHVASQGGVPPLGWPQGQPGQQQQQPGHASVTSVQPQQQHAHGSVQPAQPYPHPAAQNAWNSVQPSTSKQFLSGSVISPTGFATAQQQVPP